MRKKTIKTRFYFGDIVKHILTEKQYKIISIQINIDGGTNYGCICAEDTDWHWFKAFEIVEITEANTIGYIAIKKDKHI